MPHGVDINGSTSSLETPVLPAPISQTVQAHSAAEDDFLGRGFSLAHFIFPERTTALQILTRALNKLRAQTNQERRRTYWRDKFLKKRITHITRNDEDTLQWLIYLESDSDEKFQETKGRCSDADMVVRYVKALIRLSTGMSSFYVNIAIHRLLHFYSTSETQTLYEFLGDHYPEADEYRRAKRWLMSRLESRFGEMIHFVKTDHGEFRYEPADDQETWRTLTRSCLQMFTPWSTANKCPLKHPSGAVPHQLADVIRDHCGSGSSQDTIEISRCHVFIDPDCCGYIARTLGLEPHSSRLGVPRFYMNVDHNLRPPSPRLPDTHLTAQERQRVTDTLSAEEARRKNVKPRQLRFIANGIECGHLDLAESRKLSFQAPPGSHFLEIWTADAQGPLLLATHHVSGSESLRSERTGFSLRLRDGISVSLTSVTEQIEPRPLNISVSVEVVSFLRDKIQRTRLFPAYAAVGVLLIAMTSLSGALWHALMREHVRNNELNSQLFHQQAEQTSPHTLAAAEIATYRLEPDDLITRGSTTIQEHPIQVSSYPSVAYLMLPITPTHDQYRVTLTSLVNGKKILTEEGLPATAQGAETVIILSVPSNLLSPSTYYQVTLQDPTSQYVRTFTFYTVPAQQ